MKKKSTTFLTTLLTLVLLTSQVFAQSDISGMVLYHFKANKPIPLVELNLVDGTGVVVDTATTDLSGTYTFTNVPYGTYTLTATTSITAGGITMGDAFLMFLHLCNIYPFTPIQELAADVDGDGTVTWNDYWTVVIGWFVQGYPFPTGPWVFQDIVYIHTGEKANPPTMGGSSAGDVNGTFVPATRDLTAIQASYTEKNAGNDFDVEIFADNITEASAMGMVINYPESMVDIKDVTCQMGSVNMSVLNGQIRISWVNQSTTTISVDPEKPVIVIHAGTGSSYNGSDIKFVIDPVSHFSNYKGEQIDTHYTLPLITSSQSCLSAIYPNPFNGITNITYSLPSDARVNISLFNQGGQLVKVISETEAAAGTHYVVFDSNGLEAGVYYYTLKASEGANINETKRMIISRQ
ncbi:MAG: T9SS type A sorting domain-containing protein [Bacteroidota bacterium]